MKSKFILQSYLSAIYFVALLAFYPSIASAQEPDFTATDAIKNFKEAGGTGQTGIRRYADTYNLGATGLRGWIYDGSKNNTAKVLGLSTDLSRTILITVVGDSTPAAGKLEVDDLILGASWGSDSSLVSNFTSDARKSFGMALTEAEKANNGGLLKIKYWRKGAINQVTLTLKTFAPYTDTAPYTCDKSTDICNGARDKLLAEMAANDNYFNSGYEAYNEAVNALALLASTKKTHPKYNDLMTSLKKYADSLRAPNLDIPLLESNATWQYAYKIIFLSEYYMRTIEDNTADPNILSKLNKNTVALARAQSLYGTYGHDASTLKAGNIQHGSVGNYGPVNAAGLPANLSIVLGRKALLKANVPIDPEINDAIERADKFFGYYVNKGAIPYGEHHPRLESHALNSKDEVCAMMFHLQGGHQNETEYFTRLSIAGYNGREEGHAGFGFNYLWEGMAANIGGPLAVARYLEKVRWNLDLQRRTDGSFCYDGDVGGRLGNSTEGGSYLGYSEYNGLNSTASYLLTYSLPLKLLYITGKVSDDVTSLQPLSPAKVDNAIAAGSFQIDLDGYSNEVLITKLGEYDPIVREAAAVELNARMFDRPANNFASAKPANRLSSTQIGDLVISISNASLNTNTNVRIGVCTLLGLLREQTAFTAITERLSDSDLCVRAKAAYALGRIRTPSKIELDSMLRTYVLNAAPVANEVNWIDPLEVANGLLSDTFFQAWPSETAKSDKSLFYPAIKLALKQPDSIPRQSAAQFTYQYFDYEDAKALTADLVDCVKTRSPANVMFCTWVRDWAMATLTKFKIPEGVGAAMSMLDVPRNFDWGAENIIYRGFDALTEYGFASTVNLPELERMVVAWPKSDTPQLLAAQKSLEETVAKIKLFTSNSNNEIYTFVFPTLSNSAATISGTNITIKVPAGTDVTALAPTYTNSSTATALIASGTTRDFTTPQVYPIVASDLNLSVKNYTVTVIKLSEIIYDFSSRTLVGWNNRVWNGSAWIDRPANDTTYSPIYPFSPNNNLFGAYDGIVGPVGGSLDDHMNTLWLRSPQFYLHDEADLTVQLGGGIANTNVAPVNDLTVPFASIPGGGWKGVALRRVSDGVFVLTKAITGENNFVFRTIRFTRAELASLNLNTAYTLELINSDRGAWGWCIMGQVSIPGSVILPAVKAVLPVTSGLVLQMDASNITGVNDGAQLDTWSDSSGAANNALRQSGSSSGYPKYVSSGINGKPVVRFNSAVANKGDYFQFKRISTIRTVFWVLKENSGASDGHFLLGDSIGYDFHRGIAPNGPLWNSNYSSINIRNGTTKLMGNTINGTTTSLPSDSFKIVSLETSGNVIANQICQDRDAHGSWQGDIAEILIYDRTLSGEEEYKVGSYLSNKFGLQTNYNALPVSSGLVLRMDASKISGAADGSQLNSWSDTSGNANHAIRQSSNSAVYPQYVTNRINGLPSVKFGSNTSNIGDYLKFNRITNMRSVFWVLKQNAGLSDSPFLLGDDTFIDFHRGGSTGAFWDSYYTNANVRNGITKLMGKAINGTSTSLPTGNFQMVSLVTTGNVQANQICQDRTAHGSWQGDIAEILVYDRALTVPEELAVGTYLATKYGLTTSYPALTTLSPPTGVVATAQSSGAISVSWAPVSGASNYNVWRRNTQTDLVELVSGGTSPLTITGLSSGVSYEFKVAAIDSNGIAGSYSSIATATTLRSSACDLIGFAVPGQLNAIVSGTNISVTVAAGTSVTALAATYTASPGASGSPASGSPLNFSTPQTYTITAENGINKKVYTVTVISASLTWNSGILGNWSDESKWTGGLRPLNGGLASYILNFNALGTYAATNDLNSGFQVNRINLDSNVTLAGNSLALSVNDSVLPLLSQNGPNSVALLNNISLDASTTLGGNGNGSLTLSGLISGSGSLIKSCSGRVTLNGANSYSGGTTINAGELFIGNAGLSAALGSGPVTLNSGSVLALNRVAMVNSLTMNNATLSATNGFGDTWSGPISITGTSTFDLQNTGYLNVSGAVSGTGVLKKAGNSTTLLLSGTSNTYSGGTIVSGGTVSCSNVGSLGQGPVSIATGAKLNLAFSGSRLVTSLTLGGTAQPSGTYGSTASSATNKNNTWFSGSGVINVAPAVSFPFTWKTAANGNWGTVGSWTSGTPVAAGQSIYELNFNVAGSYTSNNSLNEGFLVNQLNFGGSSVTLTGNSLAMSSNMTKAPQLNVNSANSVTIANNLALNLTTTFGGTSTGSMALTGIISGSGGLIKSCSGRVTLYGVNTYSGGTTINAGELFIGKSGISAALGSGPVTLNSGSVLALNRVAMVNSLTMNYATLVAANGFGDTWSGPISLSGTSTFDLQTTGYLNVSGAVSGSGVLKKVGNSTTLLLSGTGNTYSGGTIVSGGILSCSNAGSLGQGPVTVASGAKLTLNFSGTRQVSTLSLGGISQPNGTYGSSASSANTKNDTYFSGPGVINVTSTVVARLAAAQSAPANTASATATASELPLPWASGTIGSGQLGGTSTYNAGTISQSGSGALGSTGDKLNFSYQTLSGDGAITAKVNALQDTGPLSRVGVMIRETLATNSKHVFMGMTGSNAYVTANRIATGGISTSGTVGTGTVPNIWVRLVRDGKVITAYKSLNGSTWTTVGRTTVTMATNCYIGLAVSSGSDSVLNNSQFTHLSVTP